MIELFLLYVVSNTDEDLVDLIDVLTENIKILNERIDRITSYKAQNQGPIIAIPMPQKSFGRNIAPHHIDCSYMNSWKKQVSSSKPQIMYPNIKPLPRPAYGSSHRAPIVRNDGNFWFPQRLSQIDNEIGAQYLNYASTNFDKFAIPKAPLSERKR